MTRRTPASRADLALHLAILSLALPFLPLGVAALLVARRAGAAVPAGAPELGTLAAARAIGIAGLALQLGLLVATAGGLAALALGGFAIARAAGVAA